MPHLADLGVTSFIFLAFLISSNFSHENRVTRSVMSMIDLISAEHLLITALTNYTKQMEVKLNVIKKILNDLKYEHEKAEIDPEEYLGNPLHSFSLIRRLHSDWLNYEYYLNEHTAVMLNTISEYATILPDENDMREAANSIQRLQSTYDLSVEDMSVGLINGIWYNSNFTVQDIYTIGYELYKNHKFHEAIPWLNLALRIPFDQKLYKDIFHIEEQYILIIYIRALIMENLYDDALAAIETALTLYPNVNEFYELLQNVYMKRKNSDFKLLKPALKEPSKYQLLCRGALPKAAKKLKCFYQINSNTFTQLAPFRVEQLSHSPYVVLYHDVLYDNEIYELQDLAVPLLERATLVGENELLSESRIAKVAWLKDNETETTKRLNLRIADMIGFDLDDSEQINIINYGLGGHYAPHFDAIGLFDKRIEVQNDRLATVLMYLNDIEQGGATVFPSLDIAVKPRKGLALLWYNVDKNGSYDSDVAHAGCPVLVGSKWVLTKWIHQTNQFQIVPYKN